MTVTFAKEFCHINKVIKIARANNLRNILDFLLNLFFFSSPFMIKSKQGGVLSVSLKGQG